jgi:hypothetical protein
MLHEETGVALRYIQVSAGAYHTVAIDEHENIRTFGSGRRGRLGHPAIGAEEEGRNNGSKESSSNSEGGGGGGGGGSSGLNSGNSRRMYYNMSRPQLVLAMKDLGCGGILLQSNDSQWAFLRHSLSQKEEGNNDGGEEGVAMKFGSNLGAMAKAVQMVACGRSHTLALTRGWSIWAWGDNEQGGTFCLVVATHVAFEKNHDHDASTTQQQHLFTVSDLVDFLSSMHQKERVLTFGS